MHCLAENIALKQKRAGSGKRKSVQLTPLASMMWGFLEFKGKHAKSNLNKQHPMSQKYACVCAQSIRPAKLKLNAQPEGLKEALLGRMAYDR